MGTLDLSGTTIDGEQCIYVYALLFDGQSHKVFADHVRKIEENCGALHRDTADIETRRPASMEFGVN